ncbi:MAG: GtrA family protein [Lachnospiraceae bacterium]|nr:GtrA family protein [Lachnospiraceae bacterium]MBR4608701.1 GtrA family protein [Lachnospiraceae bacterium]MBR6152269.1 GtrA family protein [Lachnospiraceae bacterium]
MKKLFLQAVKFIGLSGIGWILDFMTFTVFGFFSKNVTLNNFISSWVGVTFVFIFATRKVFQNNSKIPLKMKYLIYLAYQCLLIYLISKLLGYVNAWIVKSIAIEFVIKLAPTISKIFVTPITMILNFIVMKTIIEKI